MFKTIEEQNEYIEMLVRMQRKAAEWMGPEAMDRAEAKVRHDWSIAPATPWKITAQRQINEWREEIKACRDSYMQRSLLQKISRLECELACAK